MTADRTPDDRDDRPRDLRVLLVEDNPGDARYIEELFHEAEDLARRMFDDGGPRRGGSTSGGGSAAGLDRGDPEPPGDVSSGSTGAGGTATDPALESGPGSEVGGTAEDDGGAEPGGAASAGETAGRDVDEADGAATEGSGTEVGVEAATSVREPGPREGTTLEHVTRLGDGLDRLRDERFDAVLLDLNLPDSGGMDTLTSLRETDELIPVVVLTGVTDQDAGIAALREGAEEYLVKDEITPGVLVRSVAHAIERKAHERRQRRYETLIEESTDVNAIVDPDGTIQYVTPPVERVLGWTPTELVGGDVFAHVHPEDAEEVREEFERTIDEPDYRGEVEFRFAARDESWVDIHARWRNLLEDAVIGGIVVYTHDVTERKEYERQLERQRERLAALNQLNSVVHRVTEAVIERSTREEIERIVCERLVEPYRFAWIGEVDGGSGTVRPTASAGDGVEAYLEGIEITVGPDDERADGPTGRAFRTGEVQTARDVRTDPDYAPWREEALEYGVRSSAAIPIRHEETIYGVLNVYSERPDGFRHEERTLLGHLGEIIGHAIAATEHKQALLSDAVVELEIGIPDLFADRAEGMDDPVVVERAVPVGDGTFLLYGVTGASTAEVLEALGKEDDSWEELSTISEHPDGEVRFELRVSEPDTLTAIAEHGGSLERAVLEDGDYRMTVHLPQGVDVREVIEEIREQLPQADVLARRQVTDDEPSRRLTDAWMDQLTDRQRTAIEVAHYSGFFEWPRASSGEEVAESMNVSAPTFHQHVRAAEQKLFNALLEEPATKRRDRNTE